MTHGQLVCRNLLRNRRRTTLTTASVAASILLLAVFCATYRYMVAPPTPGRFYLTLVVIPRTSWTVPLPLHYGDRIARLPGVAGVSPVNMVDGMYGGPENVLWAMACTPDIVSKVYTDWGLPADQRRAFASERVALLAGRKMAEKHRWRLGDRIHLESANYHVGLDLILRGIYSSPDDESMLFLHWDYLNEAQGRPDKPGAFWVVAKSAEDVPGLMRDIDGMFRNAEVETRTQSLKQFVLDFLAMLGNIQLILVGVSAAVVFAVLLIVSNTMGMSIRERTWELAVLRALGFRAGQVFGMLAAESLAISLAGALAGCSLAWVLLRLTAGYQVGGALPVNIGLDAFTVVLAFAVATGISLVSTLLPAYRASRLNIAQALRFVG